MPTKTEWFLSKGIELLSRVPEDTYFDTKPNRLEFQAYDLMGLHKITASFPGVTWKKTWDRTLNWWEYTTTYEGVTLRIYAVRESPAKCTAVYETREVEEQVPVTYTTRKVVKEVLVGWDCVERIE